MPRRLRRLEADVRLDPERGRLEADVRLTVDAPGATELEFALHPDFVVEPIRGAGYTDVRRRSRGFVLELDEPLRAVRSFRVRVVGRPRRDGEPAITERGCGWAPHEAWLPSFDEEWAQRSIRLLAPETWSLVATGVPTDDAGRSWKAERPTRTFAFAAGPSWVRHRFESAGVPVHVATGNDADDEAEWSEILTPAMRWLAASLGPYPFDAFAIARVPGIDAPVRAGGLVLLPERSPPPTVSDAAVWLAGQWYGERVAGRGPYMDGIAAWQALDFTRDRGLPPPQAIVASREAYRGLRSADDRPLRSLGAGASPVVAIAKGSMLPDLLRTEVGPRRFHRAMQDIVRGPVRPRLDAAQFRTRFERASGRDVERIFRDWMDRRGIPDVFATMRVTAVENDQWRADVTFLQSTGPFALPVELILHGAGELRRETVRLERDRTSIYWILPFEPRRLELDPQRKLFWTARTETLPPATEP